jgi:hypothetical protein
MYLCSISACSHYGSKSFPFALSFFFAQFPQQLYNITRHNSGCNPTSAFAQVLVLDIKAACPALLNMSAEPLMLLA